jgi:serine/threonine-protein kinase
MEQIEGKYEILEKMGEGGMGSVYKVRHRVLEEIRVIKVMRPHLAADEQLRERFLREAKTAIRLRHPNVAQLYDCTVDEDGNAFMVIEFIEGVTLEQILQEMGAPPIGLTLEIATQSLKALGSLHRKKVVHRDIAPDNLMLSRDEEDEPLVKLIDLGIAKVLEAEGGLTATGMFIGKLRYSSPEHFQTQEGVSVDARSDLYSFGVVLYELLTGTHPIQGESMSSLIAGHLVHPPLEFAKSDPEGRIPDDLRAIVLKSLAKDLGERFQGAPEFRKALTPICERFPTTEDDVTRALTATPPPTIRFPAVRKSTTQDRLDRQFAPGTTPPPEPTEVTPPPVSRDTTPGLGEDSTSEVAAVQPDGLAAVGEIARRVESHLERGELSEASQVLADGEARHGMSEQLFALKQKVEEHRVSEERRVRVESLRSEAAGLAIKNKYEEALSKLQEALQLEPADTAVPAQIAEIEKAQQADEARQLEERRRRVDALKNEAATLAQGKRFDDALSKLRQALEIEPTDDAVKAQIAEVEKAKQVEQAHQLEQRRRRVDALKNEAATLAKENRFDDALSKLQQALQLEPTDDAVKAQIAEVENAQQAEQAHQLEQRRRVDSLRNEAATLAKESRFDDALSKLQQALQLEPTDDAVKAQIAEVEKAKQAEEARQLEQRRRVESLRNEAATLVKENRFDNALSKLQQALQLEPTDDAVKAQIAEVGKAQQAEEARQTEERRRRAESLLQGAKGLAAHDRYDEALSKLGQARELEPANQAVAALIAEVESAKKTAAAVAQAVALVERLVGTGDLDGAERELDAAVSRLGESPPFLASKNKIETRRAVQRERHERVRALIEDGRQLLSSGALEQARSRLDEAASLEPNDAGVAALAGDLRGAVRTREEEQRLQEKIREAADGITRRIDSGAFAAARSALDKADRRFQDAEALREVRERLGRAEEEDRRARIQAFREEASTLLDEGRLQEAVAKLEQALELDDSDQQTLEQVATARERLRQHEEKQERERAVAQAVQTVESSLGRGRFVEAHQLLQAAISQIGELEVLQDLRARVEAELAAQRERKEKVAALVEEARQRAAAGELEMALERLREADRVDPGNASVHTLIGEFEAALRRQEDERQRREQVSDATVRIERHLAGGALDAARGELDSAEKALGEVDQLTQLRQQIEAAEQRAIAEQLQGLVGEAKKLLEAARFEEAIGKLQAAHSLDSSDETVAGLLAQSRKKLRAHREEQKRQQRLAKSVAGVGKLLEAEKVAKASQRLEAAEGRFGPSEALQTLRQRVDEAVAAAPAPAEPKKRRLLVPVAVTAVILAIVVSVVVLQRRGAEVAPRGAPPETDAAVVAATSTLLVDAVPWGQITAITDADNTSRPVPDGAYTPMLLTLSPGGYTLTVAHPSRAQPVTLEVTLEEGDTVREVVEIAPPDVDSFFRDMGW